MLAVIIVSVRWTDLQKNGQNRLRCDVTKYVIGCELFCYIVLFDYPFVVLDRGDFDLFFISMMMVVNRVTGLPLTSLGIVSKGMLKCSSAAIILEKLISKT